MGNITEPPTHADDFLAEYEAYAAAKLLPEIDKELDSTGPTPPTSSPDTPLPTDDAQIPNDDGNNSFWTNSSTPEPVSAEPKDWRSLLHYKDAGEPVKKSQHNAIIICTHHPDLSESLAFNSFSLKNMLLSAPPWDRDGKYPREYADVDLTYTTAWLEGEGVYVSRNATHGAVSAAAYAHKYDPLVDYLSGLTWDGTARLTTWLEVYLGVIPCEYTQAVARASLIGAVARALCPGCKLDTMLILEGAQGKKKSTAIEILFSQDWFTDEIHALGSKDAAMQLQGNWGIEIAEMGAVSRAKAKAINEWTTRRVDKYRPPYGHSVISAPRRCALFGTINPNGSGYLKDHTGGRRFWPVVCGDLDLDAIKKDRDQLWAEAVIAYRAKEQWWLSDDIEILAKGEQLDRVEVDPWEDAIDHFIEGKDRVQVSDIMEFALELKPRDQNRLAQTRIGGYLTQLGWGTQRQRKGNCVVRFRTRPVN